MLAAGSGVGYKAFTLIASGGVTYKRTEKYGVQQLKKCVYSAGFLARSEGFPGKHSLECFASGSICSILSYHRNTANVCWRNQNRRFNTTHRVDLGLRQGSLILARALGLWQPTLKCQLEQQKPPISKELRIRDGLQNLLYLLPIASAG
jgi:hypothetical protein